MGSGFVLEVGGRGGLHFRRASEKSFQSVCRKPTHGDADGLQYVRTQNKTPHEQFVFIAAY